MCQVRTGGGLAALLPLATAPPPEAATGEPLPPPPRTTQTAAIRALLAACSLPCNRTYLLLSPHVAGLAFLVLPAAVEQATEVARRAADASDTATPVTAAGGAVGGAADGAGCVAGVAEGAEGAEGGAIDALLLPLLKLLRLLIATQPPAEPVCKLQSDLVCLLIFSGGLHELQDHCAEVCATLAGAARHQPLLLQYVALLHALLLPLQADPGCSCAAPLLAFLEETGLCGVPGLVCSVLFEGKHLTASPSAHAAALPAAWRLSPPVLPTRRNPPQLAATRCNPLQPAATSAATPVHPPV